MSDLAREASFKPKTPRELVELGLRHNDPNARRAAEAVDRNLRKQLQQLGQTLRKADGRAVERTRRAADIANAENRVERLTHELAEAKARLRDLVGGNGPTRRSRASSRIRKWCRENGVDCPARGPVPKHVRAVYDFAHGYRSGVTPGEPAAAGSIPSANRSSTANSGAAGTLDGMLNQPSRPVSSRPTQDGPR